MRAGREQRRLLRDTTDKVWMSPRRRKLESALSLLWGPLINSLEASARAQAHA